MRAQGIVQGRRGGGAGRACTRRSSSRSHAWLVSSFPRRGLSFSHCVRSIVSALCSIKTAPCERIGDQPLANRSSTKEISSCDHGRRFGEATSPPIRRVAARAASVRGVAQLWSIKWWTWRRPSEGLTPLVTTQTRPVATKRLAMGRRGSFMIRYARFQGIHAMAQRELLPRAVLGFLCTTTLRALDQRRAVKLGPQGKL